MRFKDFGEVSITTLSKGLVTVSSTTPEESRIVKTLEAKNKKHLDPWRVPTSMDSASAKIFSVKYNQEVVGQVILFNFQLNDDLKTCSVSYWIDQNYANMGITTSAVELAISYAFDDLEVHEVDAIIQPENAPSIRVIEKIKYAYRDMIGEGRIIDGHWQNYTLYTVTRDLKNANV